MPATATLLPEKLVNAWRSSRVSLDQVQEQHDNGGPADLLTRHAKAKAAYDEWRRPQLEYEAARAALAEWREHASRHVEIARGNLALSVSEVTGPLARRLRTTMDQTLAAQGTLPPDRITAKYQKLLQAMRRLERIAEEPGDDIEAILHDILNSAGVDVEELLADVAATN